MQASHGALHAADITKVCLPCTALTAMHKPSYTKVSLPCTALTAPAAHAFCSRSVWRGYKRFRTVDRLSLLPFPGKICISWKNK